MIDSNEINLLGADSRFGEQVTNGGCHLFSVALSFPAIAKA
jgi:hypothetical protein